MATANGITHRARHYGVGHGEDFFGVWQLRGDDAVLVERWPKTSEGWYRAWARFSDLEGAGDSRSMPVDDSPVRTRGRALALALVGAGIALGAGSLFPAYLNHSSLASQGDQLAEHLVMLIGWLVTAGALATSARARRSAGVFGVGLSVMAFGFYLADVAQVIAYGAHVAGAGLVLAVLGWIFCTEGCLVAALGGTRPSPIGRPGRVNVIVALVMVGLSVGVAASFAPAWDSFRLFAAATGQVSFAVAGNAFSNPAPIIAANLVVMVSFVALTMLAVSWSPVLLGSWLLIGVLVPMFAQVVSALVQLSAPPGPGAFGISNAQALRSGLDISAGLTPVFYLYCVLLSVLAVCGITRMWSARLDARRAPTSSWSSGYAAG